jgi:CDP-2,3-bis-(O-geranylgeranyl)-sn-glycerol synthase
MVWFLLLQAIWFILPAYAANAFPTLLNGKKPLDFNRKLNKKRVLGNGKTIEGTLGGVYFGFFIGLIQIYVQGFVPAEWNLGLAEMTIPLIILLSTGALTGDIFGSFIKRRLNIKRGESAPLLDQLVFLVFAIISASFIFHVRIEIILILLVITPPIHLITNIVGYVAKVKKTPW